MLMTKNAWNKNVYKKMTFQIPATLARKFRWACKRSDISMSYIIRDSMKNYIDFVDKNARSA